MSRVLSAVVALLLLVPPGTAAARDILDAAGRRVAVPETVTRVICSGPGSLRLLTYLQAQDMAVAVDDIETRRSRFDARPYAIAHPRFKSLPTFGEFRGHDDPERILTLDPAPQVILKTYGSMGHDPVELQEKTGIPVVILDYGDLMGAGRAKLNQALRTMGAVVHRAERAETVIGFLDARIADLQRRSEGVTASPAYIGGVAFKGPHGFQSTEPGYPPFAFVGLPNVAARPGLKGRELAHADVAKEKIVAWDPERLFLDLATLQLGDDAGALHELRTDPAYRSLRAVRDGKVYGLLPYNWYSRNYGSILANAYFIGKLVNPAGFSDIEPARTADEIYTFLVGAPVYAQMSALFRGWAYDVVPVR